MQVYSVTYPASVDVFMVAAMRLDEPDVPAEGSDGFTNRLEYIIYELSEWCKGVCTPLVYYLNRTGLPSITHALPCLGCTPAF